MYSNDESDLHRSSSDRDVPHKHARKKGTQKYLKESCSHCIKCTVVTFLATFMWKRPLNSTILTTATHREPERVSDGTDTWVRAQMINKCRVKMVHWDLCNVRDFLEERIGNSRKKHCSNLESRLTAKLWEQYLRINLLRLGRGRFSLVNVYYLSFFVIKIYWLVT